MNGIRPNSGVSIHPFVLFVFVGSDSSFQTFVHVLLSTEPGVSSSSFVCSHSIDDLSHRDVPIDIMDPSNGYRQGGAAKQQSFDTVPYNQPP